MGKLHGVAPRDVHPVKTQQKVARIKAGRKCGGMAVENKEAEEAEAKKGGGKVGHADGGKVGRASGGRVARASGGGCESSPFSSAHTGTTAPGRKMSRVP